MIRNVLQNWQNQEAHGICNSLPKRSKLRSMIANQDHKAPCRRRTGEAVPRAEKFGDLTKADLNALNEEGESRSNHRYAVVVVRRGKEGTSAVV